MELVFPEIALKAQGITFDFIQSLLPEYGDGLKVIFPDTGAAMLAKRDWGEVEFSVTDLGSRLTGVEYKVKETDQLFVVVCPTAVEVEKVEKLCNLAGDRPVILLLPQLEDIAIVGIGYAARQLRERFISTLTTGYYIQPLEEAALFRAYPGPWQLFRATDGETEEYELIHESQTKPVGDALEDLLKPQTGQDNPGETAAATKVGGLFKQMQQFLKALNQ